jgi:hypothetical protein
VCPVIFNGTQITAAVMLLKLLEFLAAAERPLWKGLLLSFTFAVLPFLGNFLNQIHNRVRLAACCALPASSACNSPCPLPFRASSLSSME